MWGRFLVMVACVVFAFVMLVGCGKKVGSIDEWAVPGGNLVFLSIDTTGADHMSLYGYERPTTPVLERLAAGALVFDNAISAAPSTAPSHMSMFTGMHPTIHGVTNFVRDPEGEFRRLRSALPQSIRTLAEILQEAGYRTGGFTGGGNTAGVLGFERGFDVYNDQDSGLNGNSAARLVDTRRALDWIGDAARSGEPFFAFLHTYIPHSPYVPPPQFADRYNPDYAGRIPSWDEFFTEDDGRLNTAVRDRRFWEHVDEDDPADREHLHALYDEEIGYADWLVDRLFSAMLDLGLRENTVFIITSDHGEQFQQHGEWKHHAQLWDELIHVPLLILVPAIREGDGRRIAHGVSSLELLPTILDLLGLPPDDQALERSLLPRLHGTEPWTDTPRISEFIKQRTESADGLWAPTSYLRSLRTSRYKLIQRVSRRSTIEELYDLEADPGETVNVRHRPDLAQEVNRLRRASAELTTAAGELRGAMSASAPSEATLEQLRALGYIK